jgi:hypothetical protein
MMISKHLSKCKYLESTVTNKMVQDLLAHLIIIQPCICGTLRFIAVVTSSLLDPCQFVQVEGHVVQFMTLFLRRGFSRTFNRLAKMLIVYLL